MEKQADPELFQVQANFLQGVQCTIMKRTIFALITQAINKLIRGPIKIKNVPKSGKSPQFS